MQFAIAIYNRLWTGFNMDVIANESTFGCVTNEDILFMEGAILTHSYVFASLFVILVAVSSFTFIKLLRKTRPVKFLLTVEVLTVVFGLMRALFLLADPYRVRMVLPPLFAQFLEDLAVPCLTSAFVLVQTTFWQLTKIRRLKFQRARVLLATIAAHFLIIAVIDILVIFVAGTCALLLVCQCLTALWGLLLSSGFAFTVRRLHSIEREHKTTLRISAADKFHLQRAPEDRSHAPTGKTRPAPPEGRGDVTRSTDTIATIQSISIEINEIDRIASELADSNQPTERHTTVAANSDVTTPRPPRSPMRTVGRRANPLRKVMIVGVMTSCLGVTCFVLGIYGMVVFNNPLRPVQDVRGWFVYQTLQRSVEFGFGITLSYLAWQRRRPRG